MSKSIFSYVYCMKQYSILFLVVAFSAIAFAQTGGQDVTITASGSGESMEQARQNALRNATEQAFGSFISSKTEIFNDTVVADEMASVSSGNIRSYDVLNEAQLPDGRWSATLRVIVSVDKLTTFVESRGVTLEVKGGLFALNIKQQLLNEEGEFAALTDMVGILHETMQTSFDYVIQNGTPISQDATSELWGIPLEVTATCNSNFDFCVDFFNRTLAAVSLSPAEVETYVSLNKPVFPLDVTHHNQSVTYNLRNQKSLSVIWSLASNWEFYTRLFSVHSREVKLDGSRLKGIGEVELHGLVQNFRDARRAYPDLIRLQLHFPDTDGIAATFNWTDALSLAELERVNGYSVEPRGVVSTFKHGGYVVWESEGHGLVMSPVDIGKTSWQDAIAACEKLVLNGYDDWRLPNITDMEYITIVYSLGAPAGLVSGGNDHYWTMHKSDFDDVWATFFQKYRGGEIVSVGFWNVPSMDFLVRPVRDY